MLSLSSCDKLKEMNSGSKSDKATPKAEGASTKDTLNAMGYESGRQLMAYDLSSSELNTWFKGVKEGLAGKESKVDLKTVPMLKAKFRDERSKKVAAKEKEASKPYLAKMLKEDGAKKIANGVIFRTLVEGKGKNGAIDKVVEVHYKGMFKDGKTFDSSYDRKKPVKFPLKSGPMGLIPCWVESLQLMKEGGKAKLTCPSEAAYGDRGRPPVIPPGAVLTFEVELLSVTDDVAPKPPAPKK